MKRLLIALFSILLLTGCGLFGNDDVLNPSDCSEGFHLEGELCIQDDTNNPQATFTSSADILTLVTAFNSRYELFGGLRWANDLEAAVDAVYDSPTTAQDEGTGSDDYSETNNQVQGVDEMDNVLTDGKYLYITNYNKVQIVLAYTLENGISNMGLVKEITFDELQGDHDYFYFTGLYVDDDRLLVVGHSYDYACDTYYEDKEVPDGETDSYYQECWYYRSTTTTHVFEYNKEDFTLENEYQMSGYFVGSRKIDDNIYFVTNEYIPFYYAETDENFSLDYYLPSYNINGTTISLGYEDILYVDGTNPTNFTTFYGINLDTKEVSTEVILGEGGYNMYVSTNNIYFTATKWDWNDGVIALYEDAMDSEDDTELEQITESPYEITTSIMKISINNGVVEFVAETEVPGMSLDQFSFDEYNGYLRVVTTESNWWWFWWNTDNEINNRLMILDEDLNLVSTLEGIGKPGESVQSVRFVGNFAYVVTFLRTDPFYVLDLADPENPIKLSELEIPGFSDYLQPINENFILGIGYGDNEGGTNGLKISVYDVTDKTNAIETDKIIYEYSNNSYMWTSALYNHKDLLVSASKGIIALPYTSYRWDYVDEYDWSYQYNTGVLVLNLDPETGKISERGMVEHSETNSYDTYVYKSKFIEEYLYTISSKYVMVSLLSDPETILNQVQIGESLNVEYPDEEVEPVDPVDPDTSTGTEIVDLFSDFVHVYSWEEAISQGPHEYIIYAYSTTCSHCVEIEEQIYEYAMEQGREVLFLNVDDMEDTSDFPYQGVPALIVMNELEIQEDYIGSDVILEFIQP